MAAQDKTHEDPGMTSLRTLTLAALCALAAAGTSQAADTTAAQQLAYRLVPQTFVDGAGGPASCARYRRRSSSTEGATSKV